MPRGKRRSESFVGKWIWSLTRLGPSGCAVSPAPCLRRPRWWKANALPYLLQCVPAPVEGRAWSGPLWVPIERCSQENGLSPRSPFFRFTCSASKNKTSRDGKCDALHKCRADYALSCRGGGRAMRHPCPSIVACVAADTLAFTSYGGIAAQGASGVAGREPRWTRRERGGSTVEPLATRA